jgi:hypothetical protein
MIVFGAPPLFSYQSPINWALQTGNGNTLQRRLRVHKKINRHRSPRSGITFEHLPASRPLSFFIGHYIFKHYCIYERIFTAKTKYRKFETNIPRKGVARPQSQFPPSGVCERFINSACLFCSSKICGPILGIYKSLTDTWMWKLALRLRSAPFLFWE